jgi:hypothetical protein
MSCHSYVVAACMLSLGLGSAALAEPSIVMTTETKSAVLTGTVQTVSGNTLTVRDPSGVHAYTVPDGFKFRIGGQEVGIDRLEPGTSITADITDEVDTRDVTDIRKVDGRVMQVTSGGFVLLDPQNEYVSYDFQDARGNDYHYLAPEGHEASLRDVKLGEHLSGEIVTHFPPQVIDERIVRLDVALTPGLASAPRTPLGGASATGGSR